MSEFHSFRLSVTDRCNLRCRYCMGPEGVPWLKPEEILTFEEITEVAAAGVELGVKKLRLTGGEPLVRQGIEDLAAMLAGLPGLADLALTTNGVLLAPLAGRLKRAGLRRVTVSLDSLRPEPFRRITGQDRLAEVLAGIDAALAAGLVPLKVNVVLLRGINDDQILDFVRWAVDKKIEVRFIERMPFPSGVAAHEGCGSAVPESEVWGKIEQAFGPLQPIPRANAWSGPARVYTISGNGGRVGFISPLSQPFCDDCGRMRLTPEGKIRACLATDAELDLKGPLRASAGREEIKAILRQAFLSKPRRRAARFEALSQGMFRIGG